LLELTLPRREDRPEAQGDGGGCGFDGGEPTCCICYSSRLDGQVRHPPLRSLKSTKTIGDRLRCR